MITDLVSAKGIIGAKSQNLSKILLNLKEKADFIIPKSIVVPANYYNETMKYNNIAVNSIYCKDVDEFIIPHEIMNSILKRVDEEFGNKPVIVRSSATCEDSPLFSFAGQYKSFINLRGRLDIEKAIKLCYLSFISENALLYAKIHDISLENESIAILIQEMAPVKTSGVMFTVNPVSGEDNYIIEYVDGIGVDVVAGKGKPKHIEISSENAKNFEPLFQRLYGIGKKIEVLFGRPQDIEWGYDGIDLYFFQSRPITIQSKDIQSALAVSNTKHINGKTISKGVSIGYLNILINNNLGTDIIGKIINQNKYFSFYNIIDIIKSAGVIIKSGGLLSHFANIIREFGKPCILIDKDIDLSLYNDEYVVLDADNGVIYLLKELSKKEKSELFWRSIYTLINLPCKNISAYQDIIGMSYCTKYEGVIFNIDVKDIESKLIKVASTKIFEGKQSIITYDFPDKGLIENKIILRVQYSGDNVRVQVKKLSSESNLCRREIEILIEFKSVSDATNYLERMGFEKSGYQERKIISYKLNEGIFNIICWPNALPYLGVEGISEEDIKKNCNIAEITLEEAVCTDGKEIFEKFKLNLENCSFKGDV